MSKCICKSLDYIVITTHKQISRESYVTEDTETTTEYHLIDSLITSIQLTHFSLKQTIILAIAITNSYFIS